MMDIWMLYSMFPSREEALSAARQLVEARLIACANLYAPVTSVYRWEGAVQEGEETALIAKTTKENLDSAVDMLKRLHSYELPCIITTPIAGGYPPFLQWVAEETQHPPLKR